MMLIKSKIKYLSSPQNYKITIQKTKTSEYIISLLKTEQLKKSFFACSSSDNNQSRKIHSVVLTSDILTQISNKSLSLNGQTDIKILDFIEIDAKRFIQILKQLTNIGLED
jgi:hypothetical protein